MSLPSFLCIGAQKAATSWLYLTLAEHPDVWMPPIKELHYFDHLYVPDNRVWTHQHIKQGARDAISWHVKHSEYVDLAYVHYLSDLALADVFSESWYQRAFDRPAAQGKVLGDITPEYCTIPRKGIEYVRTLLGDVKLIYIIRDPVSRALSQIRMTADRQYGKRARKLKEAQWAEVVEKTPVSNRGNYRDYIPEWVDVFGEDNILFLPFGRIKRDSRNLMAEVEQFIGVPPYGGYSSPGKAVHVTKKTKIPDSVIEPLADELRQQREFLQSYFGAGFTAST
jgi:hypothetical protein